MVFDGAQTGDNRLKFYVDSVSEPLTYDGAQPATVDGGAHLFSVGNYYDCGDGFRVDGAIDEVRVYNRALSATEIAKLYGSGAVKVGASSVALQQGSTLANGLVGHWTFDSPDTRTTITDRSGQGNNGYFIGGATSSAKTNGKLGQALRFDGVDDFVATATVISVPAQINDGILDEGCGYPRRR